MAGKMKALQIWCQQKTNGYKNVNITNMTTSWRDGLAFCALIHHYRPDLIDFDSLAKENVLHNNQLAFEIAEKELGIAALLDAEDMVAMKVPDKLSVITYVSQYYNNLNKLQPANKGAPMKRTASPPQVKTDAKRIAKPAEVPKPVLTEKVQKFSLCEICKKKVHLVERYIDEGKVYHRHCHRTQSLSGIYRREGSVAMHDYMDTSIANKKHDEPPIDTKTNPFKAQVLQNKPDNTAKVPQAKTSQPTKQIKSTQNAVESKPSEQLHVSDMVSKFSNGKSENKWTPPSKRHSRTPSSGSGNRNSTDSSELKSSPSKETTVAGSKSPTKHTWTPSSTPSVGSSKRNSTESSNSQTGNPFEDTTVLPKKASTEDPKSLTDQSATGKNDKKMQDTVSKYSEKKIDLPEKEDKVVNNSNNDVLSPSATKDMLPALLKSLADVKDKKQQDKQEFLSDKSPTSKSEPLIKELPKASPRPSWRAELTTQEHLEKPKPQPRVSKTSSNTTSDINGDEVDYNDSLNPFAESDTDMNAEPSPDVNESLNPFGEEEESKEDEGESSEGGNPFGEDEETYDEKPSEPQTRTESGRRTINVAGPNELRVNPFTQEYEHKKEAKKATVVDATPPKPPSRRKTQAPAPPRPATPKASPQKATEKVVLSPPSVVPPERKHKRAAPSWKNEMEKKMEKQNKTNKTDDKYVEKTDLKTPSPSSAQAATKITSPSHSSKGNKGVSRLPSKPARPAPGFGFPLVKRKVKSQMTEEEISTEMKVLDVQLKDLEKKGVKLEEVLRDDMDSGNDLKPESDQMLSDWFDLVHQKNKLVRRETDLVFLMQQQRLEQQHADIEFKIRKLLNKPDNEKTDAEKEEEAKLVEDLVKIVERRNTIINSIEEERVKEEEEDAAYDMMKKMQRDSPNDSDNTKKKKKNKVKKMFSKRKKPEKSQSSSQQE